MRETPRNVELLECYSAILGLGFLGRYASPVASLKSVAEAERATLIASLNQQIARLKPDEKRSFVREIASTNRFKCPGRASPLAFAGMAGVAAAVVWLVLGHSIDAQLARLLALRP
jgi:type VI secretion system protein ImpK